MTGLPKIKKSLRLFFFLLVPSKEQRTVLEDSFLASTDLTGYGRETKSKNSKNSMPLIHNSKTSKRNSTNSPISKVRLPQSQELNKLVLFPSKLETLKPAYLLRSDLGKMLTPMTSLSEPTECSRNSMMT